MKKFTQPEEGRPKKFKDHKNAQRKNEQPTGHKQVSALNIRVLVVPLLEIGFVPKRHTSRKQLPLPLIRHIDDACLCRHASGDWFPIKMVIGVPFDGFV